MEATNDQTIEPAPVKRIHKYSSDQERHEASKASKRLWYHKNKETQKLKSLRNYYIKQLKKDDLKEEIRTKYETKLNEINQLI